MNYFINLCIMNLGLESQHRWYFLVPSWSNLSHKIEAHFRRESKDCSLYLFIVMASSDLFWIIRRIVSVIRFGLPTLKSNLNISKRNARRSWIWRWNVRHKLSVTTKGNVCLAEFLLPSSNIFKRGIFEQILLSKATLSLTLSLSATVNLWKKIFDGNHKAISRKVGRPYLFDDI